MPRLTATRDMVPARNAAGTGARKPTAKTAPRKKAAPAPDRLSSREVLLRRLRRFAKPGLWALGGLIVLVLCGELFRKVPAMATSPEAVGGLRHALADTAKLAGFRLDTIEIQGAAETSPAAIRAALGVQTGDPLFGMSLDAIRARVETLGPVQTATVERVLPDTLIVSITERAAFAIWQSADTNGNPVFQLIDKAGNVIANQDAVAARRRDPSLLLLSGVDAPQNAATLVTALKANPSVLAHVAAAERVGGLRWNLALKNQTVVKLPVDDPAAAIGELAQLQGSIALLDRPVELIDLRFPGRMIVRPYPNPNAAPPAAPDQKAKAK